MLRRSRVPVALLAVAFLSASAAFGHTFSIDRDSVVTISKGFLPADVLTPGPSVHLSSIAAGLVWDNDLWQGDDVDALSAGLDSFTGPPILFFSVDRQSVGISGSPEVPSVSDVYEEAQSGQAAGDVFVTVHGHPAGVPPAWAPPNGYNMLHINQSELGLHPPVFPTEAYTGGKTIDDLDALNFSEFDLDGDGGPDIDVYFSLDNGSTSLSALGATPDDILRAAPGGASVGVFADGVTDIGLLPGDDLDALVLLDGLGRGEVTPLADRAFFSLAPGSPSLAANGYSAADILSTNFNGNFWREYTAAELGLLESDNIDALEVQPGVIPEPGTLFLIGTGCLVLIGLLRRRRMT